MVENCADWEMPGDSWSDIRIPHGETTRVRKRIICGDMAYQGIIVFSIVREGGREEHD
jgi:hypothetical protein